MENQIQQPPGGQYYIMVQFFKELLNCHRFKESCQLKIEFFYVISVGPLVGLLCSQVNSKSCQSVTKGNQIRKDGGAGKGIFDKPLLNIRRGGDGQLSHRTLKAASKYRKMLYRNSNCVLMHSYCPYSYELSFQIQSSIYTYRKTSNLVRLEK